MGKTVKMKDRMIPVLMYLTPEQIKYLERSVKKGDPARKSKTAIVRTLINSAREKKNIHKINDFA